MFIILLRLIIFLGIIFLIYTTIKFLLNPKRKLELAEEKKGFFFLDNPTDVRKNFEITYKGVRFEGEKYLGTTENAFEVVSITMWTKHPERLKGLDRNDFYFLEKEVFIHYPNSTIEWKSPVKEFLKIEK